MAKTLSEGIENTFICANIYLISPNLKKLDMWQKRIPYSTTDSST